MRAPKAIYVSVLKNHQMKILSIDPGYGRVGIAVLENNLGKNILLYSDCFETSEKLPHHRRLSLVGEEVAAIIEKWKPDVLALEELFFNKNVKTALLVSQAIGVIIYEATKSGLKVFQYSPLEIKMAVSGYGRANKDQVTSMVPKLVKITKKITLDDEFDAIAVGLTHAASHRINLVKN